MTVATADANAFRTLADLPFFVMGRYPKPLLVGRSRAGGIDGYSSHEFFERVRDLARVAPTVMTGVPRVFEKMRARRPPSALNALQHATADRLVLSKIRARFGERLKHMITSGGKKIVPQPIENVLSIERGELTPTMKVRRKAVEERWRPMIEELYTESCTESTRRG